MNNEDENLKDYDKKIYTFTPLELTRLLPWDTQIQLGAVAEKVLSGILRTDCLKRVGVKNSPDVKVEYDFITGQFFAYIPKIFCSKCTMRKASYTYENKPYCEDCAKVIRQELDAKKEEPAPKKGKNKKE